MKFEKPKPKRCYVELRDPDGKEESRSFTIYEATPAQIYERLRGEGGEPAKRRKREPATA